MTMPPLAVSRPVHFLRMLLPALFVVIVVVATINANDDYTTWQNWRYVYLITKTTAPGANVTTTQTNFPVLVRLNPGNFDGFPSTANDGSDIRFSKEDGTHLNYHIERWKHTSSTIDTAEIWVLVPSVTGNDTTKLKMFWNKVGADDSSSSQKVFDTTNGFVGVWHMSQTSGNAIDASTIFDGNPLGTPAPTYTQSGEIGYSSGFDGSNSFWGMGDRPQYHMDASDKVTISAWVKRAGAGADGTVEGIAGRWNWASGDYREYCLSNITSTGFAFQVSSLGTQATETVLSSSVTPTNGTWYYLTGMMNASNMYVFVNGVQKNSAAKTAIYASTNGLFRVGRMDNSQYWNGAIDEVRIERTNRSADWIKLCYQNQRLTNGADSLTWVSSSYPVKNYNWDNSATTGYQVGNGTWGTNAYWCNDQVGLRQGAWPGPGNSAEFGGTDGHYTITIAATQYADSLTFSNDGYLLSGGTNLILARKLTGVAFGFSPPYAAGRDSAKAFDGDVTTSCDDNSTGTGVTGIDLGSGNAAMVSRIRYWPRTSNESRMTGGLFQGSNDGSNYTTLYTIPGAPTTGTWTTVNTTNRTAYRYLRYQGPASGHCNVNEIEFYGSAGIYVATNKNDTISTVIDSTSGIFKYGGGVLTLLANNVFNGVVGILGGRIQALYLANGGSNSSLGSASNTASNLILDGGTLRYIGGDVSCDHLFTIGVSGTNYIYGSGTGTLTFSNTGSIAFTGSGARTLELGGNYTGGNHVFAPILGDGTGGTTALNKSGACTWALTSTNTYTGATTISAGTLQVGNAGPTGAISNSSAITDNSTLIFNRSNTYTFSGTISGTGTITQNGAGTLTLSGANSYSGVTTISAGTLSTSSLADGGSSCNIGSAANSAANLVINGGTLAYTGAAVSCDRLFTVGASGATIDASGTGALTLSNAGSIVYSGSTTHLITLSGSYASSGNTFTPVIGNDGANAVSVTKSGAGTWTLSGTNTYTGTTTVSVGMLWVTGSTATGNVSVSSGATLGGTGTIGGALSVSGTLSPGTTGIGKLTVNGNLTFAGGSTYNVMASGTTAGTGYDQTIAGAGTTVTLGSANLTFAFGYTPTVGHSYTIIDNQGSNPISGTFSGLSEGATFIVGYAGTNYNCSITYVGGTGSNDVVVTVTSVAGAGTDDYTQWHYQKNIYIDTKEGGANIAADQLKFPLLVRLNSSNFDFSQAMTTGADVRFSKSNGDHLQYQIGRWDNANSLAELWVRIDTVRGFNNTQYFTMYWGKNSAVDSSNSGAVFDTTIGFRGVWHLNTSGAGPRPDATFMNDSAKSKGAAYTSGGIIAGCDTFVPASSQYDSIASGKINLSGKSFTVMAWFKLDVAAPGSLYGILGQGSNTNDQGLHFGYRSGTSKCTFAFYFDDLDQLNNYSGGTNWHLLTGTYNTSNKAQILYVDGAQDNSRTASANYTGTGVFRIGNTYNGSSNYFGGNIDEVVIADSVRSSDWIKLCYETQRPNNSTVLLYEDYSTWSYSKRLYFNTRASGANVTNTVVKFPVLLRLDTTNFDFTIARDSGQDLRFAKSDGTHLYYEIESWDNVNKNAAIWVRADTIYGNDSTHFATMYWGNNLVTSRSNSKGVFDTSNGFRGVWHLGEVANSNADGYSDATCNEADAQGTNLSSGNETQAVIGRGQTLQNSSSRYITVKNALEPKFEITGNITVSAWINVNSWSPAWQAILTKGDNSWRLARNNGNGTLNFSCTGLATNTSVIGSTTLTTGGTTPYYVAAVYDRGHLYMFLNGASDATAATATGSIGTGSYNVVIGENAQATGRYFDGVIDEARVERAARNVDWIKLCYENQKPNQSFVSYTYEDYTQWAYSRKVNINTSQSGSNGAALAQNFPTLIQLTSTTFSFGQAQDNGGDIRFAKLDGTKLSYEIERWDRTNQLAEIWVLLDSVKANSGTQFVRMYWGKSGVASMSSGSKVFGTSNNYYSVLHLKETANNTGSGYRDATANVNNGTGYNFAGSERVTGMCGNGLSLNGSNQYIDLGSVGISGSASRTIEGWVKGNQTSTWATAFGFTPNLNTDNLYFDIECDNASNYVLHFHGSQPSASTPTNDNTWHYFAATYNGTTAYVYVDGKQKNTATPGLNTTDLFRIGWRQNGGNYFQGVFDEVRVSNTNRTVDWIKLCYENQKTSQTLVDLDDYDEWAYSKKIYINTSTMGLGGNVLKFPLLVRIDTTIIGGFNQAQSQGRDLRFSKADGTHLQYEIETWDSAGKAANAWVLVDTVFQSSASQYIKMYWGKSDAIAKTNSNAVFDTANGFSDVWHLNEDPNAGGAIIMDRTINGNNGTPSGAMTTADNVTGAIGKGLHFDGTNDYVSFGDINALDGLTKMTASAWVKPAALIDWSSILGKAASQTDQWQIMEGSGGMGGNGLNLTSRNAGSSTTMDGHTSGSPLSAGNWTYCVMVFDGTQSTDATRLRCFVNGAEQTLTYRPTIPASLPSTAAAVQIAKNTFESFYFQGIIDEAVISKTNRSTDWIKLCNETQKPAQTVIGVDSTTEIFLPMTVSTFGASQADSLDSCIIATKKWTLKFDRFTAGGIKWLSPDSMGTATNQLDTNLFYLITNNNRSDTGLGMLKLQDKGKVFTTLDQRKIVGGQLYIISYTVLGSGKMFLRVSTRAFSNLSPSGGLEFRIATNTTANITNAASSATASSCKFLLHSDAGANRIDPCLELYENWSQADALTGTASTKYYGIQSSTWKLPANRSQTWEFMIDFSHCTWNDTSGVLSRVNSYRTPDSLVFYQGTPLLEKSWERQMSGHWKFEEGSGDTTFDVSGSNNYGIRPSGATWTWGAGQWGRSLSLSGGNDKVLVADESGFDHLVQNGFTICAWIKPSATMSSTNGILKKFGTGGYSFSGGSGGVVQLTLNSSSLPSRTSIGSGAWHHVAAVYRRNYTPFDTIKLYIDGKPDTIFSGVKYAWDTSNADVHIGSGFNGNIDDVRFYGNDLTDEEIKAIYQLGFAANQGMYMVRADNNNTVHMAIDGYTNHRYFPTFQIKNYWSGNQPSSTTPKVYVNGVLQTFEKDYYAVLDDNQNKLTVGLNSIISDDAVRIYISSDDTISPSTRNTMAKMYWGNINSPSQHFYVKNFSGDIFGASTANQYYMDLKMDNTTTGNGGEIYRYKTSEISPYGKADTTSTGSLVYVTSNYDSMSFSTARFKIGSSWLTSTANISATPSFSVVESSSVRVRVKINDRKIKKSNDSCNIQTWFTFYPTGQVFRWDSISIPNSAVNIDTLRYDVAQIYQGSNAGTGWPLNGTSVVNQKLWGGRYGATYLQDYGAALLTLSQSDGVVTPSIFDTVRNYSTTSPAANEGKATRFVHCSQLSNAKKPFQIAMYMDVQRANFGSSAFVDSVGKGILYCTGASPTSRLTTNGNGSTILNSLGDFNADGFNEREGAYAYQADNANTAHFTLTANVDTCRFYPAFRITNYTAVSPPQYVFVNNVSKVKDFGFNAVVKTGTNELLLQLNQIICSNADIYISFDRTLAVTMDNFSASGTDATVVLKWSTQSEENNLGFYIYRRIKPAFIDSISKETDKAVIPVDSTYDFSAAGLMKIKKIDFPDTLWRLVNRQIIMGAKAGVSYGKRNYSLIDQQVFNEVKYEYKLVAVDYNSARETFNKYASAIPHRILPTQYELWANFPNPFRRLTCLKYDIPVRSKIMLNVYNIQGRLVRQLVRTDKPVRPGFYQVMWDGRDDHGRFLASGPYVYRITTQGFAKSRVMIMIK